MNDETERTTRAGIYVLGLMDERERARAERDLETDAAFRDAVAALAERMRVEGGTRQAAAAAMPVSWTDVASRLSALPQMRRAAPAEPAPEEGGPQRFGRRRTDLLPAAQRPAAGLPGMDGTWAGRFQRPLPAAPGLRLGVVALAVMLAFALGYAAGLHTAMLSAHQAAVETTGR